MLCLRMIAAADHGIEQSRLMNDAVVLKEVQVMPPLMHIAWMRISMFVRVARRKTIICCISCLLPLELPILGSLR